MGRMPSPSFPGANAHLSHTQLSAETMARTSMLLCQGEVTFEETVHAMGALREAREDATILLNLAPVPMLSGVQVIKNALRVCDILIVNESESEAVVRLLEPDGSADLPALARQHNCSVVITRGPQGAELIRPSGEETYRRRTAWYFTRRMGTELSSVATPGILVKRLVRKRSNSCKSRTATCSR